MARGPKQHLKRLFAPRDWMLSKLTGVFAPRPKCGAHKIRECMPLLIILRNRLKYALNGPEAQMIVRQKLVNVDSRPRTDRAYAVGFQDVVSLPKTGENFRMMYDVKGRFSLVKIGEAEADIKLCKVTNVFTTTGRVPVVATHDGRRIRYAHPNIAIGDTVVFNHKEGKIVDHIKAKVGKVCMIVGGANRGRIGTVLNIERHPGAFDIAHVKDEAGQEFMTRSGNIFFLGEDMNSIAVTLPKAKGIKQNLIVEREEKLIAAETRKQAQQNQKKKKVSKK